MRILLDENIPKRLKRSLDTDFEVMKVVERGWAGKKNGVLLRLVEKDFDALVTVDQSIPHQQNAPSFDLIFIVLSARSNDYADLEPPMPEANDALRKMSPGTSRRIPAS